jgi:cell division septum initiation protein DivIVA
VRDAVQRELNASMSAGVLGVSMSGGAAGQTLLVHAQAEREQIISAAHDEARRPVQHAREQAEHIAEEARSRDVRRRS